MQVMTKLIMLSSSIIAISSCNSGSNNASTASNGYTPLVQPTGSNYLTVHISPNRGGSVCSNYNQPCVSVTICSTSNKNQCTTIDNMLLDSGSSGIRVFKSLVNSLQLTQLTTDNDERVAQCINYTNSKATWGTVQLASINFDGGVSINSLPIQVIDSNFAIPPSQCIGAASSPSVFGYNGVVGISPLLADRGNYYACDNSGNCSITTLSSKDQVANPIRRLSSNNNGVVLQFPAINNSGASNVTGYAIFGIGTESNNQPIDSVMAYSIPVGVIPPYIWTTYNGRQMPGMLDTGTNTYVFPDASLPSCTQYDYYCSVQVLNLTTSVSSIDSSTTGTVNFNLDNASSLYNSKNNASNNIGSSTSGNSFTYGMPFFYGRTVYIGFAGESSSFGDGPLWAF